MFLWRHIACHSARLACDGRATAPAIELHIHKRLLVGIAALEMRAHDSAHRVAVMSVLHAVASLQGPTVGVKVFPLTRLIDALLVRRLFRVGSPRFRCRSPSFV